MIMATSMTEAQYLLYNWVFISILLLTMVLAKEIS